MTILYELGAWSRESMIKNAIGNPYLLLISHLMQPKGISGKVVCLYYDKLHQHLSTKLKINEGT